MLYKFRDEIQHENGGGFYNNSVSSAVRHVLYKFSVDGGMAGGLNLVWIYFFEF